MITLSVDFFMSDALEKGEVTNLAYPRLTTTPRAYTSNNRR